VSRAFVKEFDNEQGQEQPPERKHSDLPNYITPRGLKQLQARVEALSHQERTLAKEADNLEHAGRLQQIRSDLRYLSERLRWAIVVQPSVPPPDTVAFGARVEVRDENDVIHTFTIVGEDEADAGTGRISWASPLARAVIQRRIGDFVLWSRPAGDLELEILAVDYPAAEG
jgi:Transcription elongation factor